MRLIQGDCIEEMDKLITEEVYVDLTVTSPPYDKLRTYEGSLQWGESIWKQVIERLYKITKEGGVVVWVVGDATIKGSETGTSFKQALYFKEVGFNLHDTMIFRKKGVGACGSNYCYWQAFEYMFIFSKGKPKTIHRICDIPNVTKGTTRGKNKKQEIMKTRTNRPNIIVGEFGIRQNVWDVAVGFTAKGERSTHPAPMVESIAYDHIKSWSNEKDIVFDPFMGSGTTGKMAKKLNRDFIGIEKVEMYFDMSEKRINGEVIEAKTEESTVDGLFF
jgi:DNA modification methylase